MRLYLVRHPRPDVKEGICYGSSDIQASLSAEMEAFRLLFELLPRGLPIYTSPLSRCANLAARIARELNNDEPVADPRLVELHFGSWEMQPWDRIACKEIEAWAKNILAYRPGEGETVLEAAHRVSEFYKDMQQKAFREMIVICHAGTIRLLLACMHNEALTEIAQAAASEPHRIGYGEMIIADC